MQCVRDTSSGNPRQWQQAGGDLIENAWENIMTLELCWIIANKFLESLLSLSKWYF